MATIIEIKKLALDLSERQRATLAANLLESLPAILSDADEGVAEALRRDAELDADSDQAISMAQLDSHIQDPLSRKQPNLQRPTALESGISGA
jgi:hypothetical protein